MSDERVGRRPPTHTIVRFSLAFALVVGLVAFVASGAHREIDAATVHARVRALGPLGPLAFVLAFALVQPLGPSGHIFTVAASLLWSTPLAFALGLTGAVASQATGFVFYRYVAFDWARARVPVRLAKYEDALVERPFRSVLLLRLLTFTWPLVAALLGVSRIRFLPMILATIVGLCPGVALDVVLGEKLFGWILH